MLQNAALIARGYKQQFSRSIIPTRADKSPATAWGIYRDALIPDEALDLLFSLPDVYGLAVITGQHLAVIDFDSPNQADAFKARFPALWETRRHQTRRGLHLFFTVTPGTVSARHFPGVDFIYDGYAILPPTPGYSVERDSVPVYLSTDEYTEICAFFGGGVAPSVETPLTEHSITVRQAEQILTLTPERLRGLYRAHRQDGRNVALFKTACYAYAMGVSEESVKTALVEEFVYSPAPPGHKRDGRQARYREALKTINSAYARQPMIIRETNPRTLPAAAHQILSQRRETAVGRALDIIYKSGYGAGDIITQGEIRELDTDWSSRRVPEFLAESKLAKTRKLPPNPPQKTANAGLSKNPQAEKQCNCIPMKPTKTPNAGGRPQIGYVLPSPKQVCDWLGIGIYLIDSSDLGELGAKLPYRVACLRGVIRRNEGKPGCNQTWQAKIFGVCTATIRRWQTALGVIAYNPGRTLSGDNIKTLLPPEGDPEQWLEDATGKRYPAKPVIAFTLWRKGVKGLTLHSRYNWVYYSSEAAFDAHQKPRITQLPLKLRGDQPQTARPPKRALPAPTPATSAPAPVVTVPVNSPLPLLHHHYNDLLNWYRGEFDATNLAHWQKAFELVNMHLALHNSPAPAPKRPRQQAGQPLPDRDAEALAKHLQQKINRTAAPGKRIHIQTMRDLLTRYGAERINRAIAIASSKSRNIQNPVGYFIVMVKGDDLLRDQERI